MKPGEIEFKCPECGGSWFHSTWDTDGEGHMVDGSMVRYCRSVDEYGNEGCGFEWPEKDDWKYHVVLMYFDTEEEYEAAL